MSVQHQQHPLPSGAQAVALPYQVWQCTAVTCRLRFPARRDELRNDRCPHCGAAVVVVAQVATTSAPWVAPDDNVITPTWPLVVLVDNVRSLFNVGSIFRSADGAGISHLYLCGITPTPEHPKLAKTALGAEQSVPWTHYKNSLECAQLLVEAGYQLWALEATATATSIFTAPLPAAPLVLVIGNEVAGVDAGLLAVCAQVVALPMYGAKRSLNVATAFGAAAVLLAQRRTTTPAVLATPINHQLPTTL